MTHRIEQRPQGFDREEVADWAPPGWARLVTAAWDRVSQAGGIITHVGSHPDALVLVPRHLPADGEATLELVRILQAVGSVCASCGKPGSLQERRPGVPGTERIVACASCFCRWREGHTTFTAMLGAWDARPQEDRDDSYEEMDWEDAGEEWMS